MAPPSLPPGLATLWSPPSVDLEGWLSVKASGGGFGGGEAKKKISLEEHAKATEGVECKKDESVLDESPAAYKDIDAVMEAQKDLVEIVHTLKQVLCVKG
jgi:tRNA-splicing ligase RtcB